MNGVSVLILTWQGIDLVKECFPLVLEEIASWDIETEILLLDNGSTDGTVDYIKEVFPDVKVIAYEQNLGFSRANNLAVKEAKYDALLFLNNDLTLEKKFIQPLLERLVYEDVFAVAPKILRWDKKTIDDGLRYGKYYSGFFDVALDINLDKVDKLHVVTFFCGACFLCKKDLFKRLGGFDELYTPYAWEDLDLGYRAWKRGYKIVYEPRSIAYHKREATTRGAFSNFFFITLMWRNKFIFMWKNLTYKPFIVNHLLLLPWKLIKFLFNGRWNVVGFLRAVKYLPAILKKRKDEKEFEKISDQSVLSVSYAIINNG